VNATSRSALRTLIAGAAGLLAAGRADVASAQRALNINPTRVVLTQSASGQPVTVRNESAVPMRFQVTAFVWSQSRDGDMVLAPTEDIVCFPMVFEVGARQERRIRVGALVGFAPVEKSYRIFIEELPPDADDAAGGVAVRTRIGIPVFLQPPAPRRAATIREVSLNGRSMHFTIQNAGSVHFLPQQLAVTGFGRDGQKSFEQPLSAWYVLAGGVLEKRLVLPEEENPQQDGCRDVRTLVVTMTVDRQVMRSELHTPDGICGQ
jgi:fimbrial chaperone protein